MERREKRYAEALLEIALENEATDDFQKGLEIINEAYSGCGELRDFLGAPEIPGKVKKDALRRMFEGKVRHEVLNLILLLVDRRSVKLIPGIAEQYSKLAEKNKNILTLEI